jgi:hypothetical protein
VARDGEIVPFVDENGAPVETVDLRQVGKKTFQLLRGFYYEDPADRNARIPVPAHDTTSPATGGNATDLASVPPLLWGLIASYGLHTRAALMHDKLCVDAHSVPTWRNAFRVRREADRLFRVALRESHVPWVRRWLMWAAVSVGRYFSHVRPLGILLVLHLLATVTVWVAAPFLLDGFWLVVAILVPLLLLLLWGRDAAVITVGCLAAPVVLPVLVIGGLTAVLLWIPSLIVWFAREKSDDIGPPSLAPFRLEEQTF